MTPYPTVTYTTRTLFASELLRAGEVLARPTASEPGELRQIDHNVIVLPLRGLFTTHLAPRREALATITDAVLLPANTPHRYGFPGCIGDHCLVLRWTADSLSRLVPEILERDSFSAKHLAIRGLLPPQALLDRAMLWHGLTTGIPEALMVEDLSVRILRSALLAARKDARQRCEVDRRGRARQRRGIASVRAAITAHPVRAWSLADLAALANMSPYHLAHVFRAEVGTSVFDYVSRIRLGRALHAALHSNQDLTSIALDAGFASHSHFTARFRTLFGRTPSALRNALRGASVAELHKITTAN